MLTIPPKPFPCLIGRFDVSKTENPQVVEKLKALGVTHDEAEALHNFAQERGLNLVQLIGVVTKLVAALRSGDLATVLSLLLSLVGTPAAAPK